MTEKEILAKAEALHAELADVSIDDGERSLTEIHSAARQIKAAYRALEQELGRPILPDIEGPARPRIRAAGPVPW